MEKKSVCKSCKSTGEPYQSEHGLLYSWNVEFDNGDKGLCNTKKNEPPFEVTKECDYDISEIQKKNGTGTYFKIKKAEKKEFKAADPTVKLKSMSLSYANRFVLQDVVPRPKDLDGESTEEWNKFLTVVSKYAQSFYKEMKFDLDKYGAKFSDVIGVAMSNAIDARIQGKIKRDMLFIYYRNLLSSLLTEPQAQQ